MTKTRLLLVLASAGLLSFSAPGAASPPATVELSAPWRDRSADRLAIEARTRSFEEALAHHQAKMAQPGGSERILELARGAAERIGPGRRGLGRIAFPSQVSADEAGRLANARRALAEALELVRTRGDEATRRLTLLESSAARSPGGDRLAAQARAARRKIASRSHDLAAALGLAADAVDARAGGLVSRLRYWVWQVFGSDAPARTAVVISMLEQWSARVEQETLGAELTYVQAAATPPALPEAAITPAYLDAAADPVQLEDTTAGREVELSPEVVAKAHALGTAAAAYEFVKNEAELEWYLGTLKGSAETLRSLRGNDADLATLLVALLRAQGTPARYVHGTIRLTIEKLADLMGLLSPDELDGSYQTGETRYVATPEIRDRALRVLAAAGVPHRPVVEGGAVVAVELGHVWAEAWLPYGQYRGAVRGNRGAAWVPMDPAVKGGPNSAGAAAAIGLGDLGLTAEGLTAGYLEGREARAPITYYRARIEEELARARPGGAYADLLRRVERRPERLGFVPGTLPFQVVATHGEFAFLPEALTHRIRFVARDADGDVLDLVVPLHQVTAHRTFLAYRPATEADREYLALNGGPFRSPASLVRLLPAVRIDGRERAVGTRSIGLGENQAWRVELLLPDGSSRPIDNTVIAGNLVAVGVAAPGNELPNAPSTGADLDGPAARFLYARAAEYASRWTASEDELARLVDVLPVRPTANVAFVRYQLAVQEVLGVRQRVEWRGLEIDADLRATVPVELRAGAARDLLRLSGYEGSFIESAVLAEATGVRAVSAVSVLQEAKAQGNPVLHLAPGATDGLAQVSASGEVLRDLRDQLARGREVLVPTDELTIEGWHGTGYVAWDPRTQEAGYFLSGLVSGGQTVISPRFWEDPSILDMLDQPDAPEAIEDVSRVARIIKVPETDFQRGVVGRQLDRSLTVVVTTMEGIPVKNAPVAFKSADVSRPTFVDPLGGGTAQPSITVMTDASGRARARCLPDTLIGNLEILEQAYPNWQIVGLNRVEAITSNGGVTVVTAEPFVAVGFPDEPHHIASGPVPPSLAGGVESYTPFSVAVEDQYQNAIANREVVWTQSRPEGRFLLRAAASTSIRLLDPASPEQSTRLVQTTDTFGTVVTSYVPGFPAGDYVLSATSGALQTDLRFSVHSNDPYYLAIAIPAQARLAGVTGTSFPGPITGQILKREGIGDASRWVPLTGREPDIESATVRMKVTDPVEKTVLADESQQPFTVASGGPLAGIDDARTVAFWPRYLSRSGKERLEFTAVVYASDHQRWIPTSSYVLEVGSNPAEVVASRIVHGLPVKVDACNTAFAGDDQLRFAVKNPASFPVYVEVIQSPRVSGEKLVEVPPPDMAQRAPWNSNLIQLAPERISMLDVGIVKPNRGGTVELRVYATDPGSGPAATVEIGRTTAELESGLQNSLVLARNTLRARLIYPVLSPRAAGKASAEQALPVDVSPTRIPAWLGFCAQGDGLVTVRKGSEVLARGLLETKEGYQTIAPPTSADAAPLLTRSGRLVVAVPPGQWALEQVTVRFEPSEQGAEALERTARLITDFQTGWGGGGPGQTRVQAADAPPRLLSGVTVPDGSLTQSYEDLRLAGPGPEVALVRAYSSRGGDRSPLGSGWTHSFRSFLLPEPDVADDVPESEGGPVEPPLPAAPAGARRHILVTSEGMQRFSCSSGFDGCRPQPGFHGTLRGETVTDTTGESVRPVFRSKTGVEYRFGPLDSLASPARHRLESITDPAGNAVALEYGGADQDGEVVRVYQPGNRRFLQLFYETPENATRPHLARVALMDNPAAPQRLSPEDAGEPIVPGVCIEYDYDSNENLAAARRLDGPCGESAAVARAESWTYQEGDDPRAQDNLRTYTDPNGKVTTWAFFASGDVIPGEADFPGYGGKTERLKSITEPMNAVTTFTYDLRVQQIEGFDGAVAACKTEVAGPRPGVPATTYWAEQEAAEVVRLERPLSPGVMAITTSAWDPVHAKPVAERDPRGRVTRYAYDGAGNLIERRISAAALPATAISPALAAARDGAGRSVTQAVERWSYDPAFNGVTCHIDAAGRVDLSTYDSSGSDPASAAPTGTGLLLATVRLAARVDPAALGGAGSCTDLAGALPRDGARDISIQRRYCGVDASCVPGAARGDLVGVVDGEGNATDVQRYDRWRNPIITAVHPSQGVSFTTTSTFDARGRLQDRRDTAGHHEAFDYDALDRVTRRERLNTKGSSPGLVQTFEYFPAGQLRSETNGFGDFQRETTLDALNRVASVTESGGGLSAPLVTRTSFDQAGNRWKVVDRRGVATETTYDFGGRPVKVRQYVEDRTAYQAQDGADGTVGLDGQIAAAGWDEAGNKLYETDLHGHRTDYRLDALYRVISQESPAVPGASFGAAALRYTVERRYDLAGNKVWERDGNGAEQAWEFDAAGRIVVATDPVGRRGRTRYDRNGNVVERTTEGPGGERHLVRTTTYDGLNRVRTVTEDLARVDGSRVQYHQETVYDDGTHTVSVRDRRGFVTTRRLDDLDRVYAEVADDPAGLLARRPDDPGAGPALALTRGYEFDAAGNRRASVDPLGRRAEEDRDGLGRVLVRRLPMGASETFVYDGESHVLAKTDSRGIVRKTRFDPAGRATQERIVEGGSNGGTELVTHRVVYSDAADSSGLVSTEEFDALHHRTVRVVDGLHRELQVLDAMGGTAEARFDAAHRRAARDRKGFVTEYDVDGAGRPVAQREKDLGGAVVFTQAWSYDDGARAETWTDRRAVPTVTVRDGLGRVERVTRTADGADRVESTRYDGNGNVVAAVDPNGHETRTVFDGTGRRIAETRGAGTAVAARTEYRYDAAGNLIEQKGPRGAWAFDLHVDYDDLDHPVRSEDALGNVTTRAFDAAGNKLCEKRPLGGDPLGRGGARGLTLAELQDRACAGGGTTRFAYNEASKIVSVVDALGGELTVVYDAARNVVGTQDANGNLTTYGYDLLNRRTDVWQHLDAHPRIRSRTDLPSGSEGLPDPASGTGALHWHVTLDPNGNPATAIDPRGLVTRTRFGVLDRLERTEFTQTEGRDLPSTDAIEYERDGNGNARIAREWKTTAAGAAVEETVRGFDGFDRLVSERRYDGKLVSYAYDTKGNRARVTDPDGVATSYTYDALDRIDSATMPDGTATYRYWPDGLAKRTQFPNGVVEAHCYDAAGRQTAVVGARGQVDDACATTAPLVSRFDYEYDANGNRTRQLEQRTDPATQAVRPVEATLYGYDGADRLVGVKYADGTAVLYRLDAVGNRAGERRTLASKVATLDAAAFASVAPADLGSDVTATFNRADWLLSRIDAMDGTRTVQFGWDLAGNLVSRERPGSSRQFRWDARNTLTAVYDNGVLVGRYDYDRDGMRVKRWTVHETVEYVLDDKFVLQEARGDAPAHPAYRRYHYAEAPLAVSDAAGTRFIGTDGLGSLSDLVRQDGTVATARQYDAWGQHRNGSAPAAGDPKLGYTGHQFDPETGLVYARARYYDPELGIFLSRDPLEGDLADAPSLHRYAYARNNPLAYFDPDGLSARTFLKGMVKGAIVTIGVGVAITVVVAFLPEVAVILPVLGPLGLAAMVATTASTLRQWANDEITDDEAHERLGELLGGLLAAPAVPPLAKPLAGEAAKARTAVNAVFETAARPPLVTPEGITVPVAVAAPKAVTYWWSAATAAGANSLMVAGGGGSGGGSGSSEQPEGTLAEDPDGPGTELSAKPSGEERGPSAEEALAARERASVADESSWSRAADTVSGEPAPSRVTSPNRTARQLAQGKYIDPITNETVETSQVLAADHIIPQRLITKMPGFATLTPEQQAAVLNHAENIQGLPKTFNSSKGGKLPAEWSSYKGDPLHPDYMRRNAEIQATLLQDLQAMIDNFISTNAPGGT